MSDSFLDTLLAKQAISEAILAHGRAFDRRDPQLMATAYHPGARVDFQGLLQGTIEEVIPVLMEGHPAFAAHSHQITGTTVTVGDDVAESEAYFTATSRSHPDASGRVLDHVFRGRYLDRWSRRDGVWAIEERVVVTDIQSAYDVVTDAG